MRTGPGRREELADNHSGVGKSGEGKTSLVVGGSGWRNCDSWDSNVFILGCRRVLEEGLRREGGHRPGKAKIRGRRLRHEEEDQKVEKQCFPTWRRGGFPVEADGSVDRWIGYGGRG